MERDRKKDQKKASKQHFELKPLSKKAKTVIRESTAPINIYHGAVRSTKTIDATIAWIGFIARSKDDEFLQTGKTRRSLYRNVLRTELSIFDRYGVDYEHRAGDGYIDLEGNIIWLMGFHNESVVDTIRGMTLGGWYSDETNTYPKIAVEEALDRLSLDGARAYMTMNPDSPYHYINTDYISNQTLLESGDVKAFHFTLYDNPYLPRSYIAQMERRYPTGTIGNKRKILGLWVIAEGVIYDRFMEHTNTFEQVPYATYTKTGVSNEYGPTYRLNSLNYDYYVISTDWGGGNVTVFGLFGIKRTPQGNQYHLLDEFYWDISQHNGRGLEVSEAADKAMALLNQDGIQLPLKAFFTPHDAASLRNTLKARYYQGSHIPVRTYTPNTLEDIESIKPLISDGRFKISSKKCPNSIAQMQTYAWDPKAQSRGEDRPLKVNDHCPDMWRAALLGTRNLGALNEGYTKSSYVYTGAKRSRRSRR